MWRPYIPVAARRARALREMNRLRKKGKDIQPVEIEGRTIARSVWGKRWCNHLESWSDYANRLPRGRTYVRNGSVCHLEVHPGRIDAIVSGSELYTVSVRIRKLKAAVWKSIKVRCSGQIASMLELLRGRLSQQVMSVVSDREQGLFPKPREIDFTCTCPDWATMCKHVAAVLYGVGGRLDRHPESLFVLRGVDAEELIDAEIALPSSSAAGDDTLADDALAGIFGIDIDTEAVSDADTAPPLVKAPAGAREGVGRRAKAPARTRKGVRPRAASAAGGPARPARKAEGASATATGRRASRAGKAGGCTSASKASARRRTRKAGTGATRRAKTPTKRKDTLRDPTVRHPRRKVLSRRRARRRFKAGRESFRFRGLRGAYPQSSIERRPGKENRSHRLAPQAWCRQEHRSAGLQPPAHRQVGGPAAPALWPLRCRVRKPPRRVAGHGVPLGSHARSTQPARALTERSDPPAPAERDANEAVIRHPNSADASLRMAHGRVFQGYPGAASSWPRGDGSPSVRSVGQSTRQGLSRIL